MAETRALEFKVDQHPGELIGNFEELNTWMDAQLEKYRGLVFNDDQMADAKKTRAALNRVAKELNDRKLSVKNEFCAPYFQFEDQVKQLINKVKEVNEGIDSQIREYEDARKEEKRRRIEAWWAENGKRTVPIEKVFDPKYLNTTCSDKQWQSDLEAKKTRIGNDIYSLMQMKDPDHPGKVDFLLADYIQCLDVSATLGRWEDHVRAEKQAAEEKERLEQERIQRESEQAENEERRAAEAAPEPRKELGKEDYLYSPTFKVLDLTYQQAMDLTNYMRSNGMKFISIAKERREK